MPDPGWWAPELRRAEEGSLRAAEESWHRRCWLKAGSTLSRCQAAAFQIRRVQYSSRSTQGMSGLVLPGRNLLNSGKSVSAKRGTYQCFL